MEVDGGLRLEVMSAILFIAWTRELFESCVLLNFPEFHSITFRRQGISLLKHFTTSQYNRRDMAGLVGLTACL